MAAEGRGLGIPPGVLLMGAGLGPVVFALKHRGQDGWWLGLLALPLFVWGLVRFARFMRSPQV